MAAPAVSIEVLDGHVADELACGRRGVRAKAPPHPAGRNVGRDLRVEADAGDVEEQAAGKLAGIQAPLAAVDGLPQRGRRVEWNPELAREAVARAARHEPQRRAGERQGLPHLVDRAVAAPGHHEPRTGFHGGRGEIVGVIGTARDLDAVRLPRAGEHFPGDGRTLVGSPAPPGTRGRIDDDDDHAVVQESFRKSVIAMSTLERSAAFTAGQLFAARTRVFQE